MPLHASHRATRFPLWPGFGFVIAALIGLGALFIEPVETWAQRHYLSWHQVLEMISIAFAFAVFTAGWSTYRKRPGKHILYLACAFLGVSLLGISHTLSFPGMPDFITPNRPVETIGFGLVAQYMAAVGLLILVWIPWPGSKALPQQQARRIQLLAPLSLVLGIVALTNGVMLYATHWLASLFGDPGLTTLNVIAGYGIVTLHLLALVILLRRAPSNSEFNLHLLIGTIFFLVASELLFTSYTEVPGTALLLGHIYKAAAYFLLYTALDTGWPKQPPHRNQQIKHAIQAALANEQMRLVFQPVLNTANGQLSGAEVLIRWTHPKLGIISPSEFIPIAEDSGLMPEIGEWVLRNAIVQISLWVKQGLSPSTTFSVNLSLVQFRYPLLVEHIQQLLDQYQLPAQYLGLEITESVAMDNAESAIQTLHSLKQRGIKLSIDDFGTGYASLSHLKLFDARTLKIDQSFIKDIVQDARDHEIVRAIITMAHTLGMLTIAEGVETAEQLNALKILGCDQVQGYYFSRPLHSKAFEAFWLLRQRQSTPP